LPGDCHGSADCAGLGVVEGGGLDPLAAGWLCTANFCRSCDNAAATPEARDLRCSLDYGGIAGTYICDTDGVCKPGTCHDDADCTDPDDPQAGSSVCSEDRVCVPCNDVSNPCGPGKVCDAGLCYPGECAKDADCAAYGPQADCLLQSHRCNVCDNDLDCLTAYNLAPVITSQCLNIAGWCNLAQGACVALETFVTNDRVYAGKCFVGGECYGKGDALPSAPPEYACLHCFPFPEKGGSRVAWTPGGVNGVNKDQLDPTHCFLPLADDPNEALCFPAGTTAADAQSATTAIGADKSRECQVCDPLPADRQTLLAWSDVPDPAAAFDWTAPAVACTEPWFQVPTSVLNQKAWSRTPAVAGTLEDGVCRTGRCEGISWTPWLPLGMAGAGTQFERDADNQPIPNTTIGATPMYLFGTFGGGFGSGIPNANPGCKAIADCGPCNPFGVECL
jgi:hypothetical protein